MPFSHSWMMLFIFPAWKISSNAMATLAHIRVVMDKSRTISSSKPEMVSNCLTCCMFTIATAVAMMEELCSLFKCQTFFFLIMDSEAAVSLHLGQGHFQRARHPTRCAAKDQGNAGKSMTKRGRGLLLLVSLLAIDATESLRQWLCSRKAEWQPALNWVTCWWSAKEKKIAYSPIIGPARQRRKNGAKQTTCERVRRGPRVQSFWAFYFLHQPIHFLGERETALLNWLESEPSAGEARRTVFVSTWDGRRWQREVEEADSIKGGRHTQMFENSPPSIFLTMSVLHRRNSWMLRACTFKSPGNVCVYCIWVCSFSTIGSM